MVYEGTAIAPRLLSKVEAARYCGYQSYDSLLKMIEKGLIPGPIPGTARFDRLAIDAALNKISGLIDKTS